MNDYLMKFLLSVGYTGDSDIKLKSDIVCGLGYRNEKFSFLIRSKNKNLRAYFSINLLIRFKTFEL